MPSNSCFNCVHLPVCEIPVIISDLLDGKTHFKQNNDARKAITPILLALGKQCCFFKAE